MCKAILLCYRQIIHKQAIFPYRSNLFRTINRRESGSNLPRIGDLESIYCRLPYSRKQTFAPLVDASPSQFLCPYTRHCFALCHCCDYDACDCEMSCPVGCSCYHDATWNTNIVECTRLESRDDIKEEIR